MAPQDFKAGEEKFTVRNTNGTGPYTLVSRDTQDQEFSANRQLFLTEQGYQYIILYDDEVAEYEPRRLASTIVN